MPEFAQEMMRRASKISIKDKSLKEIADVFGLNGFFAVDSSTVSLDLKNSSGQFLRKDMVESSFTRCTIY